MDRWSGLFRALVCAVLLSLPCLGGAADLSRSDRDFDVDFEADDVLALNMSANGKAAARALGFRVRAAEPLRHLRLWLTRLRPPPAINVRAALERLRKADPTGIYGLNESYALAGAPVSCGDGRCYGRPLVGWAGSCDDSVRIGMVDSAVNVAAPNLRGRAVTSKRFSDAPAGAAEAMHGSAIATLLVGGPDAEPIGLLPRARLFAADVFSVGHDGNLSTDAARIMAGLDWLTGSRPAAINISLEGPDSPVLAVVTQRVVEGGIALVAAAGNRGPDAPPAYPGSYPKVIAVTAVDRYRHAYASANQGFYIDLAAPGVDLWTADASGLGVLRSGTSFATPFVTAAVARLVAQQPRLGPEGAGRWLEERAADLGEPGRDPVFGAGLLRAPPCGQDME